jgi:hypothetical protein
MTDIQWCTPADISQRPACGMAEIKNKTDFYKLYRKLQLGNTTHNFTWDQYLKEQKASFDVGVRNTIPGSPLMKYNMSRKEAISYGAELLTKHGLKPEQLIISELAPDDKLTIQVEALRTTRYVYARYSQIPGLRMREAMLNAKHIEGLAALHLMKQHMDGSSWNFLNDVWDDYPDSVVEFTCYDRSVGVFGWNTLFWEVRNY